MSFYINPSQIALKAYPGLLSKVLRQCHALQLRLSSGSWTSLIQSSSVTNRPDKMIFSIQNCESRWFITSSPKRGQRYAHPGQTNVKTLPRSRTEGR